MTVPALGLPVQDKFQLYVYEKGGLALWVVTQHGSAWSSKTYSKLPPNDL
jgi:hypothetical protein